MTSYRPALIVAAPAVALILAALRSDSDAMYVGGLVFGVAILGAAGAMVHEAWAERRWRRRMWGPALSLSDRELEALRRRRYANEAHDRRN